VPPATGDPGADAPACPPLEFRVANGRLDAAPEADALAEAWLELPARAIDWGAPQRLEWGSGERAVLLELHVPRPSTRQLRVGGPSGLAWALFPPGTDGSWRPRASAAATGVAGGTTHAKLSEAGVWALVLFQDAAGAPGGPVEISLEEEEAAQPTSLFLQDAHELRRFVVASLAFALALALGEAGRTYLHTGNIWTSWGMVPIGTVFLLFPTSFAVTMLWHTFRSIAVLRGEEPRRTPTFANRPLEMDVAVWPSVTIQIPVFRERFDDAIRPTLDAAREAARRYREQTGASCNLLVCEDGLLYFAGNDLEGALAEARRTEPGARSPGQLEILARTTYYDAFDVPVVARPWPEPGVPGTERPGRFRKASNLNYALRLADRLGGGKLLSEAHARFREAVPESVYQLGYSRGDVRVGEIVVQLDKDSVIPPEVIRATVPEFLADPTLAYTQHASYPTNEERYFSAVIGWFTRLLYDLSIRAKCLIPGTLTPLMGHNVFLRRSDLLRVGAWYEHSVCEDLELLLRLHECGRHGKYIAYPGQDFGEAVTRVYTEELEKFRRYAFGAAEAVLNPISEWERRGIVKESWRRFCRSEHVRWYQVVDLLQFFFSLVNLASLVPLGILTGLGFVHPYRAASMLVMSVIVFGLVPIPAIYLLRRRGGLGGMPAGRIWGTRFGAWKAVAAQLALSYTFVGSSLAVTRGALAHLLNRPLVFSETNADDLGRLPRRAHLRSPAMRRTARDGLVLLAVGGALAFWRIHLDPSYGVGTGPFDWRFHFVWLYPLVVTALTPLAFHPYILGGRDLPRSAQRPRALSRGATRTALKTRKPAASRRQGAA
jgi:Glycosyl transferase family group 2